MPSEIRALFPLHAVLFPAATMPLHLFEPRYLTLLERALDGDRQFGIVAIRLGMEAGGAAELHEAGTLCAIRQVTRRRADTVDIEVEGTRRFSIVERLPDEPHPQGLITPVDEEPEGPDAAARVMPARAALHRYLSVRARLSGSDLPAPPASEDPVGASFAIAAALAIEVPEAQRLLAAPDAATRLAQCIEIARREALLLEHVGPPVGRPSTLASSN